MAELVRRSIKDGAVIVTWASSAYLDFLRTRMLCTWLKKVHEYSACTRRPASGSDGGAGQAQQQGWGGNRHLGKQRLPGLPAQLGALHHQLGC